MKSFLLLLIAFLFQNVSFAQDNWEKVYGHADSLMQMREFKASIKYYESALQLSKDEFGEHSVRYLKTLNGLGRSFSYISEKDTIALFLLKTLEQCYAIDSTSAEYAYALHNLGTFYLPISKGNDLEKSMNYLNRALFLRRKVLGEMNLDYTFTLNNLATCYKIKSDVSMAKELLIKVIAIRKSIFGEKGFEYAKAVNDLAIYYEQLHQLDSAELLYNNVRRLYLEEFGVESPNYSQSLNNLGIVHAKLGNYELAKDYFIECLRLRELYLGPKHVKLTHTIANLALVQHTLGEYQESLKNNQRIKTLYEELNYIDNLEYANFCNNIALLYLDLNNTSEAEKYFETAKNLYTKFLTETDIEYINFINNQAHLNIISNKFHKGDSISNVAVALAQKNLESTHELIAYTLYIRALGAFNTREYYTADSLLLSCIEIHEKNKTTTSMKYIWALDALSKSKFLQSDKRAYIQWQEKLFLTINTCINKLFPSMTESNKALFYANSILPYTQAHISILANNFSNKRAYLYTHSLRYKGLLLQSTLKMKQRILDSSDSSLIHSFLEWQKMSMEMTFLSGGASPVNEKYYDSLLNKCVEMERDLSKRSQAFASITDTSSVNWTAIKDKLKKDEAAVEILKFKKYTQTHTVIDSSNYTVSEFPTYPHIQLSDSVQYIALICKKNSSEPEIVFLENSDQLETIHLIYYKNAIAHKLEDVNTYTKYWKPLAEKLKGIKKVFLSPDGVYNQIALSALQNPKTKNFLIDELDIHIVSSTKDILRFGQKVNPKKSAALYGHPIYEIDNTKSKNSDNLLNDSDTLRNFTSFQNITLLPNTLLEVEKIQSILSNEDYLVDLYTNFDATEENVKRVANPSILHISTHGFFNSNQINSNSNPLLKSGLLFTGVSTLNRSNLIVDSEDGVLTALEAANLTLDQTELVVLSACETGLGEAVDGEGVYGLQRAFKVAGAKSMIMSLWKVNDQVTQELMTTFYTNFKKYKNFRKAFILAQKNIKKSYPHPYYWAAFVFVGE